MTNREAILDLAFDGLEVDEIAVILGITGDQVLDVLEGYAGEELADSMDGDFDSAMSSAGYGMDEDYGSTYEMDDY